MVCASVPAIIQSLKLVDYALCALARVDIFDDKHWNINERTIRSNSGKKEM